MDPLAVEWSEVQSRTMELMRAWAVASTELQHHMAAWMDLPTSDAAALGHVIWADQDSQQLSPGDLARRLGMTSGATTALLNRLEAAGHLHRSREQADRRRVTLRPSEDALRVAREFLVFSGAEIAELVAGTSEEELRVVSGFVRRLTGAATTANHRLTHRIGG